LYSFWAAADDIGSVSIDPVGAKEAKGQAAALLSFSHKPTGKWKLELVATKDAKEAVRAFAGMLGEGRVDVNIRLKKA